jgi:hypothetical protein
MVTARLAHVIRYITPGIEDAAWHGGGRPRSFPAKSMAASARGDDRLTRRRSKPPSGEVTAIRGGAVTLAEAADAFLSSPRAASPNTRRAYAGVIDRLAAELGPHRQLAAVPGDEIAAALRRLWGKRAPSTWNRNRAAVVSRLNWCADRKRWPTPQLPGAAEMSPYAYVGGYSPRRCISSWARRRRPSVILV